MFRFISGTMGVFLLLLFSGCTRTTVILMPDETGKVGALTVKTKSDFRVVNRAYNTIAITQGSQHLSESVAMSESEVNSEYANVLRAQPSKACSFVLYFFTDSTELTRESRALITQIIDKIKERSPTEISIIGHTDTTGSDDGNQKLSLERAKMVEKLLKDRMANPGPMSVKWFGSKDLLIPTPVNINEPRNRRVEILIL